MESENDGIEELTTDRLSTLQQNEEILLTVTNGGFGKRSSAYEYRVSGRGGLGIANINLTGKNGNKVVATFPVWDNTDVMLVTDKGRLIRVPVHQIRITARSGMGVTLFRIDPGEEVSSVFPVSDDGSENDSDEPLDTDDEISSVTDDGIKDHDA